MAASGSVGRGASPLHIDDAEQLIRRGSKETGLEHTLHANDPAASVRTEQPSGDCSARDEPTQGNIWVKNCELLGRAPAAHRWADWKLVTIR